MALGSNSAKKYTSRPTVYLRLRHGDDGGFEQTIKEKENVKKVMHTDFSGRVAMFKLREEVTAAKAKELRAQGIDPRTVDVAAMAPKDLQLVCMVRLRDDNPAEPDVALNFNLDDSLAQKFVGGLNALRLNGQLTANVQSNPVIMMNYFHRPANSKYNSSPKAKDSVNTFYVDENGERGEKINPVYMSAENTVYADADGGNNLPMGEHVGVGTKHEYWDFQARDNIILETAMAVRDVFPVQSNADHEQNAEQDDAAINLDEAAAAASVPQP